MERGVGDEDNWSRALGGGVGGEEGLVARAGKGVGDEEELGLESAKTQQCRRKGLVKWVVHLQHFQTNGLIFLTMLFLF